MDDINEQSDIALTDEQASEWNRRTNDMRSGKVQPLSTDDLVARAEVKIAARRS